MKRSFYMIMASISALLMIGCEDGYGPMGGRWDHMMNYGYGHGFGGMFMGILLIVVIIVVAYFIIQSVRAKTSGGASQETHLDILKKRYAKGEITKEDYERIKKDLEG